MGWTPLKDRQLTELWNEGRTGDQIADELGDGLSRSAVLARARRLDLPRRPKGRGKGRRTTYGHGGGRVPYTSKYHRIPSAKPGNGLTLRATHPALHENRTLFRSTVRLAEDVKTVLKSGHNQRKIGHRVAKGAWRGFPIMCLTLEERATCPTSCRHWRDCYGNNMHLAERIRADEVFERILWLELEDLQHKHPGGFVVRLHILGDFYSVGYVGLWRRALRAFPALNVFGYTARKTSEPIGMAVAKLVKDVPGRFVIRRSGWTGKMGATTFAKGEKPVGIPCPAQTGATDCCATCALCWSTDKTIAFESHGDKRGPRDQRSRLGGQP